MDLAAEKIAHKKVVEHLIDYNEKSLRTLTNPTNHLTLAAALSEATPVLSNMIDQHAVAKLFYDPAVIPEGGRAAARATKKGDGDEESPKGDGLGGLGPGGALRRAGHGRC